MVCNMVQELGTSTMSKDVENMVQELGTSARNDNVGLRSWFIFVGGEFDVSWKY